VSDEKAVRDLLEKEAIAKVLNRLFLATDARDWPRVRECFADSVHFDIDVARRRPAGPAVAGRDHRGLGGGPAALDALHHQTATSKSRVPGTRPAARALRGGLALPAHPLRPEQSRVFVGQLRLPRPAPRRGLEDRPFRFNSKFVDGNLELEREPSV